MIVECIVLRRIKHFQHRARRISAPVAPQFVDLVQNEYGIAHAHALYALDNLPRHGADISPAMPPDFGFVFQTAQRKSVKFALQRAVNRSRQTRFSDARRSQKTYNLPLMIGLELADGQKFQYPLFDIVKTEVILFQYALRVFQIQYIFRRRFPRQVAQPIQICAYNVCFARFGRQHRQSAQFFFCARLCLARHPRSLNARFVILHRHRDFVFLFAQLFAYRPKLLSEKKLFLTRFDPFAYLVVDLLPQCRKFQFPHQYFIHNLKTARYIERFQYFLALFVGNIEMRRNHVGQTARILYRYHARQQIARQLRRFHVQKFIQTVCYIALIRRQFIRFFGFVGDIFDFRYQTIAFQKRHYAHAADAMHNHRIRTVGHARHPHDMSDAADFRQIVGLERRRIVAFSP